MINLINLSDSYKFSHFLQYPNGTEIIHSYLAPRGGEYEKVVMHGLPYILKKYLNELQVLWENIEKSEALAKAHGVPFNKEGWQYIHKEHNGRLPIEIKALPEGAIVGNKEPLLTIENTDPKCAWLVGYLETLLLKIWYPITIASKSLAVKEMLLKHWEKTADDVSGVDFAYHNFGDRGSSSVESASIGGVAHLTQFKGTDNFNCLEHSNKYYDGKYQGFSIPASEHSTVTSWGRENEFEMIENYLETFKGSPIIACVLDSYDIYKAVDFVTSGKMKEKIESKDYPIFVIRPDCYDDKTEILTNTGWKLFKDLQDNDLVAQYDNSFISFVKPEKYIEQDYKGDMVNFKSSAFKIDLLVTPNHRMVSLDKNGFPTIQEAKDIKFYDKKDLPVAERKDGNTHYLTPFDKLMIAYQADGRCKNLEKDRPLGGKYLIEFQFAKKRKIDALLAICKEGVFDYRITKPKSRQYGNENWNPQTSITVHLDRKPFKRFLEWVDFSDKSWVWCRYFIEEISKWDATVRSPKRIKFDNSNLQDAIVVQQAAFFSAYRTTFTTSKDNRSEKFSDIHTVHITKTNRINGQAIKKSIINYEGKVYCVKVPSGMIVVKRNGQITISGNSGEPLEVIPKMIEIAEKNKVGYSINSKGYKLLNKFRVIQGDGVNPQKIDDILNKMESLGYSATNFAFGSGGDLMQNVSRDTLKFAMKCSAIKVNGEWRDVYKDPITDQGKKSIRWRVEDSRFVTVFKNGEVLC